MLFAHVGHWIFYVLYAVPVLIVLASIVVSRGREDDEDLTPPAPE